MEKLELSEARKKVQEQEIAEQRNHLSNME